MHLPDEVKIDQEQLNIKIKSGLCGLNIISLEAAIFAYQRFDNQKLY